MSSSPTIYKNESLNSERRSGSREPLKWVVLVYFGQDNWGKLVDLSESGMRFEFAQPPSNPKRDKAHQFHFASRTSLRKPLRKHCRKSTKTNCSFTQCLPTPAGSHSRIQHLRL